LAIELKPAKEMKFNESNKAKPTFQVKTSYYPSIKTIFSTNATSFMGAFF